MKYIQQVTGILVVILLIFNCIDINAQAKRRGTGTVVASQKKKPYIDDAEYLVCKCEQRLSKAKYVDGVFYYDPCPKCKKVWAHNCKTNKIYEVPSIQKESKVNYNDDPHHEKPIYEKCWNVDSVLVNNMKYYTFKNNCRRELYIIITKNGKQNYFKILPPHSKVTIEWETKNDLWIEPFHNKPEFQEKAKGCPEYPSYEG